MLSGTFSADTVCLVGERVDPAGIDPAIVEVEQGANGDGEINGVILPAHGVERLDVSRLDAGRVVVHFGDEAEEGFVLCVEFGVFQIAQDPPDQFFIAQQFGRDRGVGLQSKWAVVVIGSESRDQLADTRTEGSRAAQDLLGKARQVNRGRGQIGEQMPDLGIFRAALLHGADHVRKRARLRILFDARQKHRLHGFMNCRMHLPPGQ